MRQDFSLPDAPFGLVLIRELTRHGYALSPGTLYPLLHELERAGYVRHDDRVVHGKLRKYYRATTLGQRGRYGNGSSCLMSAGMGHNLCLGPSLWQDIFPPLGWQSTLSPTFTPAICTLSSLPSVVLMVAMPLSSTDDTVPTISAAKVAVESITIMTTTLMKIVTILCTMTVYSPSPAVEVSSTGRIRCLYMLPS
ncbi:MAG: PadR family transcriptional regulator [Planctomycetaceae bacterium]|nr:MAG: PadR family transcriptional regulator [Planctomycetaceae bacterium]